jgi:ATP-dependent DNA helicase PIF1
MSIKAAVVGLEARRLAGGTPAVRREAGVHSLPLCAAMTFDELLDWVDLALPRLKKRRIAKERRAHVERLHQILTNAGDEEQHSKDWFALAKKIATLLKEPVPDVPAIAKLTRRRPRPAAAPVWGHHRQGQAYARTSVKRRATRPPRESLQMNAQLDAAFAAVEKRRQIVFVTGGAGTGKSTFIHELRERLPDRKIVVLAPTGVAALNAGGQTIHSFCQLPLRAVRPEDIREIDEREVVENLDLLVIDEVSMVRADILDGVERFLRVNRRSTAPFGGVQIVLVGDLFQLPPVVTSSDRPFLEERYASPHFFSAHCLRGLSFTPVELQVVYRQRDAEFATLLRSVRDGDDVASAVAEINRQCVGRALTGQYLILVPTRKAAAEENERRLEGLPGKARTYAARAEGTFGSGSDDRLPAPEKLALKRGAQVMFTRNDPEKRWVNGTVGIVDRMQDSSIAVKLADGVVHDVEVVEWQNLRYAWDESEKTIMEDVLGSFVQYPLMPAWSVTIHKAQGLTLARVAVDFGRGAFAEGQVYVALSRCQTLEGLSLARPVRAHEVRCSSEARSFYAKMRRGAAG